MYIYHVFVFALHKPESPKQMLELIIPESSVTKLFIANGRYFP